MNNINTYIGIAVALFVVISIFWINGLSFSGVSLDSNFQITEKPNEDTNENVYPLLITEDENLGVYIVDTSGRTLYTTKEECLNECLNVWPPYIADNNVVDGTDLGTVLRDDIGVYQYTWMGQGLYYFSQDTKAGEINGEGIKGVWSVARPKQ